MFSKNSFQKTNFFNLFDIEKKARRIQIIVNLNIFMEYQKHGPIKSVIE